MEQNALPRRSFLGSALALPLGWAGQEPRPQSAPSAGKVAAGEARLGQALKLPGGNLLSVKVGTEESRGAFFMAEQPSGPRGAGPPKHFHENVDEWWYILAGEWVFEIGDQRFRLVTGDSILGPRGVPHAFVYDSLTPGRLLVGFTPAGRMEEFFRELERRGAYFGTGTADDREKSRRDYGIVNVGPPLRL